MSEIWVLAVGAAVAGLVQGISGFAFAMAAMAIWVWGVDPQVAAVMAVFGGLTGQIISVLRVRRGWHLSLLWPFVIGIGVGIPLGTRLLPLLDPNRFKLVLGSMLVVCCSAMLANGAVTEREGRRSLGRCRGGPARRRHGALEWFQRSGARLVGHAARLLEGRTQRGLAELQSGRAGGHDGVAREAAHLSNCDGLPSCVGYCHGLRCGSGFRLLRRGGASRLPFRA